LFAAAARLVHGILGGLLGVVDGLLALALDFLNGAFALQFVGTNGFTNALLGLADGFVGGAFDLVCGATHETLLAKSLRRDKSRVNQMFSRRLVSDRGFL